MTRPPTPAPEHILDTVVLRVMSFAHPDGIDILLKAIGHDQARFPAEVYDRDEDTLPLDADGRGLSELAHGIRYARQQVARLPPAEARRYDTWLANATQLSRHLQRGSLAIDRLTLDEIALRVRIEQDYGIGRGEAACLTLSRRDGATAVFLSSDRRACRAATELRVPFLTLEQMLDAWVTAAKPVRGELAMLVTGMRSAKYALDDDLLRRLMARAGA